MILQMLPTEAILVIMGALTLFVIGALCTELELPLPVTLAITVPVVVAGAGVAKVLAMNTRLLFPDVVVGLCVVLFFMAGGYEITNSSP